MQTSAHLEQNNSFSHVTLVVIYSECLLPFLSILLGFFLFNSFSWLTLSEYVPLKSSDFSYQPSKCVITTFFWTAALCCSLSYYFKLTFTKFRGLHLIFLSCSTQLRDNKIWIYTLSLMDVKQQLHSTKKWLNFVWLYDVQSPLLHIDSR